MNKDKVFKCLDLQINGNCTKGMDCEICMKRNLYFIPNEVSEKLKLNTNAKHYIPKSKQNLNTKNANDVTNNITYSSQQTSSQVEAKIKFNLDAAEYIPKFAQNSKTSNYEEDNIDDDCQEEFDLIMKDIINNELMEEMGEEESDEERWFPKYSNCECCKGFVYKCKGAACENLGICYCKMREDCDEDEEI